jgi:methyl-accepting chemotaxis protein
MVEYGGWILLGIVLVVLVAKGKVDLNDILQLYKLREANKDLQALATSLSGQLEEANKALIRANNEIKNLQHKVEDLTNQIKETGEKVVEQVKDSGKKVEETVKDTGKQIETTIQDKSDAVNQKIDSAMDKVKDVLDKYKGFIKK